MVKYRAAESALTRSIASVNAEIQNVHEHETKLNNSFSIWREMSDTHVYSRDDEHGSAGLQSIIRSLCRKHKVIIKELTVSSPRDMSDDYKKQYTKVCCAIPWWVDNLRSAGISDGNCRYAERDSSGFALCRVSKDDFPAISNYLMQLLTKSSDVDIQAVSRLRATTCDFYRTKGNSFVKRGKELSDADVKDIERAIERKMRKDEVEKFAGVTAVSVVRIQRSIKGQGLQR
ncbi:hypothetical protein GH714_042524 [Hevea brasiliensis]|uniref:Uncharacterized protein n=1 Tax=Hevea brasiliensis TaxID=3981 RepID=A0A6A6JYL3_HEVBR|nr:hypothetical protein GH714_042524 [Hevea brasiliensis]